MGRSLKPHFLHDDGSANISKKAKRMKKRADDSRKAKVVYGGEEEGVLDDPLFMGSEDEAPEEVPTKKADWSKYQQEKGTPHFTPLDCDIPLSAAPEKGVSLFDQVMAQKDKKKALKEKRERRESKKAHKIKQIDEGQFVAMTKKGAFKVVTLDKGIERPLVPSENFRENVLRARTAHRRVKTSQWTKRIHVGRNKTLANMTR